MKSSINGNDRKFYENCLNIISDIRIKYGLKGIQVKEIEELFSGVKYIESKEQIRIEIYNKNKKGRFCEIFSTSENEKNDTSRVQKKVL